MISVFVASAIFSLWLFVSNRGYERRREERRAKFKKAEQVKSDLLKAKQAELLEPCKAAVAFAESELRINKMAVQLCKDKEVDLKRQLAELDASK